MTQVLYAHMNNKTNKQTKEIAGDRKARVVSVQLEG
jgi:hypothetical protein